MKLLKHLLFALTVCACLQLNAQDNAAPKWVSMQFSKKVSLQTAMIQVNNKTVTYADLLKIPDTSVLKVEVYSKKAALQFVDKDEARNGLVQVTLHKKHFPYPVVTNDSGMYIIQNNDTIYCSHIKPALLDDDTTNTSWIHFLQRYLKPQVAANNGAPPGVYFVDMIFLINQDGSISEVSILEDPGYGTAAEVKRLMSNSPDWSSAMCDDIPVRYRERQRITFFINEQ